MYKPNSGNNRLNRKKSRRNIIFSLKKRKLYLDDAKYEKTKK